ncbi:MAG: UDP-4-amino-4,6-dideoxy-N-acetyl-beta-L-altrosamine transaminase [Butyrivibrio sp.]|uniref:UDP-4-amino-4, 6-dideoxy-N-acetyl-beta-L-altrosamine transaminase n=1 Tax=Butyrivibrio sp. TaxID=28121 RepID=UPI0025ED5A02|nr:UDP-4-amino-4,6-dideoxy-N-acetyl-beta-L-altrosamine transaminase [Butyrivibrio sp.]MCR5773010.1 UDP-4-amino-4,6-dideoxy-N-acetyl-beta-L-altrosamine transaminase [Butyrivibrio sp.]
MEKLAIEGGSPVRPEKLYYGRQWVTEEDAEEVKKTLLSDYITCGPKVDEAEKMLCEYTGAKYAVVVSNCTAALHLAASAAGISKGDELITTPLTFMASANCALYCGGKPVFADINPDTYNIDPDSIEAHITPNTKAVVAVDFTGQVVEADRIREICNKHGLVFIEDAAHSIGSSYDGKKVGSIADMTCFSFHPVKTVTCGEGGAILTDNKEYYEKLLLLRSHGMEHDESKMLEGPHEGVWYYEQQLLGFNYRMTDIQAALLCSQLRKIDSFVARRKEIVAKYDEAFKNIPEIIVQKNTPKSDTSRHLYIIQLDLDKLNCTRRQFFDAMSAENIQCQVHYVPVYWFPYYKSLGYKEGLCPKAEKVYKGIMSIPLYPRLTDKDVDDVIHAVTKIIENYRK